MKMIMYVVMPFLMLLYGCGGASMEFNAMEKTEQLRQGMMHKDVVSLLGKPKSVKFVGDKVVLKYSLHEVWKGWVPYYTIFEKRSGVLLQWYSDEAEYQRNQAAWAAVFREFENQLNTQQQAASSGSGGSGGSGTYMEGYDPNANYYTNDYSWEGSGYHYDD